MFNIRSLINGAIRSRTMLTRARIPNIPTVMRVRRSHAEGPPQPFDNMPFSVPSRLVTECVVQSKKLKSNQFSVISFADVGTKNLQ